MARFSKAALLKHLSEAEKMAAAQRDKAHERKRPMLAEWFDGQWTAYAQLADAIERGEIGEDK